MNDYDDDNQLLQAPTAAQRQNRLLIEDPDDAYLGNRGSMGAPGASFAPQGNLSPLLTDDDDMAMSLGMPKLQEMVNAKKHAAARGIFNTAMHNQRAANPWTKTGQRTEKNVYGMFGEKPRDFEGTARLFGRKAGNFRAQDRQKWKGLGFFGRLKRAFKGEPGAPKRTWMERLFGARKKSQDLTASEKSAFAAQRNGASWADALAPLNDDGSAMHEEWKDEDKASGSVVQIEDKVPAQAQAQAQAQADEVDSLESKELPQQQFIEEEEEKQEDDNQTVDDNSIDNDDDEDNDYISPAERFAMEQAQQRIWGKS